MLCWPRACEAVGSPRKATRLQGFLCMAVFAHLPSLHPEHQCTRGNGGGGLSSHFQKAATASKCSEPTKTRWACKTRFLSQPEPAGRSHPQPAKASAPGPPPPGSQHATGTTPLQPQAPPPRPTRAAAGGGGTCLGALQIPARCLRRAFAKRTAQPLPAATAQQKQAQAPAGAPLPVEHIQAPLGERAQPLERQGGSSLQRFQTRLSRLAGRAGKNGTEPHHVSGAVPGEGGQSGEPAASVPASTPTPKPPPGVARHCLWDSQRWLLQPGALSRRRKRGAVGEPPEVGQAPWQWALSQRRGTLPRKARGQRRCPTEQTRSNQHGCRHTGPALTLSGSAPTLAQVCRCFGGRMQSCKELPAEDSPGRSSLAGAP